MELNKSIILGILGMVFLVILRMFIQMNDTSKEPILILKSEEVTVGYISDFYYLDYVEEASDYHGNDLRKEKYVVYDTKELSDKDYYLTYTLTDYDGRKAKANMTVHTLYKEDGYERYEIKDNSKGRKKSAPKKENKTFLASDYDGEILVAKSKAMEYGRESSQVYSVEEIYDDEHKLLGYECVFSDEESEK